MKQYIFLFSLFVNFSCHKNIDIDKKSNCNNKEEIIAIAEKEWLKIYGKSIYDKKPFIVTKINDSVWAVSGTLNKGLGGVPYIEINSKTCEVIEITHGK